MPVKMISFDWFRDDKYFDEIWAKYIFKKTTTTKDNKDLPIRLCVSPNIIPPYDK